MKNILSAIGDLIYRGLSNSEREESSQLLRELQAKDEITLPQAYGMLLVDMALIDQSFDAREYEFIFNFFKARFGMNDAEIRELVHQCSALLANFRSTHAFAEHMAKTLSKEEREEVLATLRELIDADEVKDGFEVYLKQKFRDLLGLGLEEASTTK